MKNPKSGILAPFGKWVLPFSEALIIILLKSFLELELKSARTAEMVLSMLILIRGVLAEALSEQLNPGKL